MYQWKYIWYHISVVKNPAANAEDEGDTGLIPGSGRFSEVGNGKREAWQASPWGHRESDMT